MMAWVGRGRLQAHGLLQERDRLIGLAELMTNGAQQIQNLGVRAVGRQGLAVELFGILQLACLMVGLGLLQQLHGIRHSDSPLNLPKAWPQPRPVAEWMNDFPCTKIGYARPIASGNRPRLDEVRRL